MLSLSSLLTYLLVFTGAVSAFLVVLVIYGNALDTRADEEIILNKTEQEMLEGEQPLIASRMHRLARVIIVVAIIAGASLLASAGIWAYIGLFRS
jgi:uncharacterized membrane protein